MTDFFFAFDFFQLTPGGGWKSASEALRGRPSCCWSDPGAASGALLLLEGSSGSGAAAVNNSSGSAVSVGACQGLLKLQHTVQHMCQVSSMLPAMAAGGCIS